VIFAAILDSRTISAVLRGSRNRRVRVAERAEGAVAAVVTMGQYSVLYIVTITARASKRVQNIVFLDVIGSPSKFLFYMRLKDFGKVLRGGFL
jgi:hypothetical protein